MLLSLPHELFEIVESSLHCKGGVYIACLAFTCKEFWTRYGRLLRKDVVQHAVQLGYPNVAQWLMDAGAPCGHTDVYKISLTGDLKLLKWCKYHGMSMMLAGAGAAEKGHLHILQWLKTSKFSFATEDCYMAVANGQQNILEWYEMEGSALGWNEAHMQRAAENEHFHLIEWLHERGCPMDEDVYLAGVRSGNVNVVIRLEALGCPKAMRATEDAAGRGYVNMLLHLKRTLPITGRTWESAALKGQLHVLYTMLREWNLSVPSVYNVMVCAAQSGCTRTLQWLSDQGFPFQIRDVWEAAGHSGSVQMMKWLYEEKNLKPDLRAMKAVVRAHEPIDALRWLRSVGCEWDATVFAEAVVMGDLETIKFLLAKGCPWDERTWEKAKHFAWGIDNYRMIRRWLREQGCPGSHRYDPHTRPF